MEETNTTELSVSTMTSGYAGSPTANGTWCLPESHGLLTITVVSSGVCLCGLVGNMVVIWFLGFRMKKSPFTVYVLNLAVADFSLLLFLLVYLLLYIFSEFCCFFFEHTMIYYILMDLFLFSYFVSMYLLTAMSLERCVSVLFPIWYRCHRPKRLSGILCGVIWALATLFISLESIACYSPVNIRCLTVLEVVSIVNFIIFSLFPFLSNISLFIKLRCGSQRRHPGRLYVAVLLSVVFLFIFGFPFNVIIYVDPLYYTEYPLYICCLLASLNSCTNPFIYFLVGSCRQGRFQGSARVALHRVFEERATSEERSRVPGGPTVECSV
ncbi:proto-oncogene Mas-like [Aegotheles albertisi]